MGSVNLSDPKSHLALVLNGLLFHLLPQGAPTAKLSLMPARLTALICH
jgi:hypothetical protein